MSARSITFNSLLTGFFLNIGHDIASETAFTKSQFTNWLNNAYRWAWRRPKEGPWSEAVKFLSVTITAGKVAWADIEYAETWRFWSEDPRPYTSTAYPIDSTHDADGIWPRTDLGVVCAEYLPRLPKFSSVAYDNAATYAVDDVMLFTDNNAYRCIVATTAGQSPVTTPASWSVQPVLEILQSATLYEAESYQKQSKNELELSAKLHADSEEDLQDEWTKDTRGSHCKSYPPLTWH